MSIHPGNLTGAPRRGLKGTTRAPKQSRRKKQGKLDPDYLADVRRLPCVICDAFGFQQKTRTEAHHTFCGRFGQDKTPDRQAIPLCNGHHEGDMETGKIAIHLDKALWVDTYGPDTDFIAITQDAVARLRGET
ncbi:hypothetical protein ACFOHK_08420 [Falsigemmobacter intermedius]|uniref:DUF968 domain-containing protein n=1 Tax=Falsigemmobacter intermedius TaxID=1553448 RepID=A0A3S3U834_9RHOB|nr:hypothetical protein [Falsigemmobacter intermedius]RWY36394.1 hypothetical protein EP867_18135 [Falsigemmobacter intermedius]